MNTKLLMIVSAAVLGAAGIMLTFLPLEVSSYLGMAGTSSVMLQVLGSLYFGFAMLNWTAKANLIGGIYSKPVAIGNFTHFLIGGLALAKLAFRNMSITYIFIAAIIYLIFSIFFGYVLYNNPVLKNKSA
ncbi:MAG: hypothetical protein ABI402_11360 [Ferruginibacter sp.]